MERVMAATSPSLRHEVEELVLEQIRALKQPGQLDDRDIFRVAPAAFQDHGALPRIGLQEETRAA